jgi:hypothetical protein
MKEVRRRYVHVNTEVDFIDKLIRHNPIVMSEIAKELHVVESEVAQRKDLHTLTETADESL